MSPRHYWIVFSFLFLWRPSAFAQQYKLIDGPGVWSVGAGLGATYYLGDLRPKIGQGQFDLNPGLAISAGYQLSDFVQLRGELRCVRVSGSQISTPNRSNYLSFQTTNPEVRVGLLASLFPATEQRKWNPYLTASAGLTYLSPRAKDVDNQWVDLPPLHTEGVSYARLVGLTSLGVGVNVRLSPLYQLGIDLTDTFILSDYFDDVSTVYLRADQLSSPLAIALADRRPELGAPPNPPGTPRGNPKDNDSYLMIGVRVSRFLNTRINVKEKARMKCLSY